MTRRHAALFPVLLLGCWLSLENPAAALTFCKGNSNSPNDFNIDLTAGFAPSLPAHPSNPLSGGQLTATGATGINVPGWIPGTSSPSCTGSPGASCNQNGWSLYQGICNCPTTINASIALFGANMPATFSTASELVVLIYAPGNNLTFDTQTAYAFQSYSAGQCQTGSGAPMYGGTNIPLNDFYDNILNTGAPNCNPNQWALNLAAADVIPFTFTQGTPAANLYNTVPITIRFPYLGGFSFPSYPVNFSVGVYNTVRNTQGQVVCYDVAKPFEISITS